jgi:uncharacterized membrane protein
MAHGAFLLFVVNVVGTVISAALTFIAAGLVPGWRLMSGESSIAAGLRLMTLAVIMVVLPLQFGRGRVLPASDRTAEVVAAVHEFVEAAPGDVVDISIGMVGGVTDVAVVVATSSPKPPRAGALADFLAARIDTPVTLELKVVEATTTSGVATTPQ